MQVETLTSGRTSILMMDFAGVAAADAEKRRALVTEARPLAEEELRQKGAVLLRGLGVDSAADFHDVVACFGDPFVEYLHGNSPRKAVHEGVWTSTEYPAEYDISLHNELSQAYRWPDRLFFCCLTVAQAGGETPVSDGRAMLSEMDPEVRARFEAYGVAYLQSMHGG